MILDFLGRDHRHLFKRNMTPLQFPHAVVAISDQYPGNQFIRMFRVNLTFFDKFFEQSFAKSALGARVAGISGADDAA
ncbi:MAG: hypothetical protein A3J07_02740 [Candidatus Doudnabacteria bacterium RIFCSPLOWO2_02_FULL_49_13]|nr:MAG: hypothetical protein A3J07_02740 [Candidatus Doudnabacteria bacterium RIFCSPLOWO2_02_FULL_49_13]